MTNFAVTRNELTIAAKTSPVSHVNATSPWQSRTLVVDTAEAKSPSDLPANAPFNHSCESCRDVGHRCSKEPSIGASAAYVQCQGAHSCFLKTNVEWTATSTVGQGVVRCDGAYCPETNTPNSDATNPTTTSARKSPMQIAAPYWFLNRAQVCFMKCACV